MSNLGQSKRGCKRVYLGIAVIMVISMLLEYMPKLPNLKQVKFFENINEVQAETTFQNPRILEDSSMESEQKVTWDCIWFGYYPQSEITSKDGKIYNDLKKANGWDINNDIVIGNEKYRRLNAENATAYMENWEQGYDWKNDYTTYHYFKYEPIKWRILSIDGEDAFLFADVALDDQKYNLNRSEITWENSSIRSWLNGYAAGVNEPKVNYTSKNFINCAFSLEERNAIKTSTIVDSKNAEYGIKGGNTTLDKIFLLSESEINRTVEAKKYGFAELAEINDEARRRQCSTYALAMGTWERHTKDEEEAKYNGNIWWPLRSIGEDNLKVASIGFTGSFDIDRMSEMYTSSGGILPALHLNLSATNSYSYAGTVSSDGTKSEVNAIKNVNPRWENTAFSTENKNNKVKINRITLSGISKKIAAGKKITLKPSILPTNASNKKLNWKSSNTKVAIVTQSGIVTLKKKTGGKKVTITATATDGSKAKASWQITSMQGVVNKVKITGNKTIKAGKKLKLRVKVTATKKANTKLLWTSNNTKYATVNTNGVITTEKSAKGKKVKITATATDGSGKKSTVTIKIK